MESNHQTPPEMLFSCKDNEFQSIKPALEPETLLNHVQSLATSSNNNFPVNVFPNEIQEIIFATNEALKYPIDFTGASILFGLSVATGNTLQVEIKQGWQESPVIYLAIVGSPGTNKSHPFSFALKPLNERDREQFSTYETDIKEFDRVNSLTKKEKEEEGITEPPERPTWKQLLVSDFTPEALMDVHRANPRGIGVYVDELATWFKNFNRYNNGSEEQFWLSNWSGKPLRVNRKTSKNIYIHRPCISVGGTIQPGVMNDLAFNREENGFLDRMLFVYPDGLKKEHWPNKELDPQYSERWDNIVNKLTNIPVRTDESGTPTPTIIGFNPDAKSKLFQWQAEKTDEVNTPGNEHLAGIQAKMESYAGRLALILELAKYATGESELQTVSLNSVDGAIQLTDYFRNMAIKAQGSINDPLAKLPTDKQSLFHALPDEFSTSDGVTIAKEFNIPERSFKRFLGKNDLFMSPSRGTYQKKI